MRKILLLLSIVIFFASCAKDNDSTRPPETKADEATRIENSAAKAGVFIRYVPKTYSTDTYIEYSGVGKTDAELLAAIEILKEYFISVKRTAPSSTDAADRQSVAQSAIGALQAKRTEIVTGKICESLKK